MKLFIFLLGMTVLPPAWGATVAEEMKALIEAGKRGEAYSLGLKYPGQLGAPDFDYFFGIAAIDAGHAGVGVLALERYLLNFPENERARLDIARGYFLLGEDVRAREEFESVAAKNPPQWIIATINRYLDAIRARQGRHQTTSNIYVEAGMGWDSNVNSGVGSATIYLPTLGNVLVSATGMMTADRFAHLAVGAQASTPVAPDIMVSIGGDVAVKNHVNNTAFDQTSAGIAGSVTLRRDEDIFRGNLIYSRLMVESDDYRDVRGEAAEWIRQLNPRQSLNASVSHARLDYTGVNGVRNSEVFGIGSGFRHALAMDWQPVLMLGVSYAEERNKRARDDLGRTLRGVSMQVNCSPDPKWDVSLGYAFNQSRYGAPDQLLLSTRKDDYHSLATAVTRLVSRNLSVRAELLLVRNDSNIALYDFKRSMAALKVRYEWK